jgi:RNA polymerase sigma-70 factor (ECF subfamily)
MTHLSEEALVELARAGDGDAFAELIRRNANASRKLAASVLRDREDAEDALQDAWSKAWLHVDRFQGDSKFSTWFTRIVLNQCLMRLRSLKRKPLVSLDEAEADPDRASIVVAEKSPNPEQSASSEQIASLVRQEVQRMPPLLRDPLIMRDLQAQPIEDVARNLDISIPAVKSRLLRARTELRKRLERHFPGGFTSMSAGL